MHNGPNGAHFIPIRFKCILIVREDFLCIISFYFQTKVNVGTIKLILEIRKSFHWRTGDPCPPAIVSCSVLAATSPEWEQLPESLAPLHPLTLFPIVL